MKKILLGLGGLLVLLVLISFALPRKVFVARSKVIAAPASEIQLFITSPGRWEAWAPWNKRDPQMKVTLGPVKEGEGASWSWESESQGSGSLAITLVQQDTIGMAMSFTEDGESDKAESGFSFKPEGNKTLVTWSMTLNCGNNPIYRYLGLMFDSMVGKDYEEGLENLKKLAEGETTADAQ